MAANGAWRGTNEGWRTRVAEWLDHEIAEATERHDWVTALDGRL